MEQLVYAFLINKTIMTKIHAANQSLEKLALQIRLDILDMVEKAGSGHIDSSFSCVEILTALFYDVMRHEPNASDMPNRDRFILSKGHAAPALYATLARLGYFDTAELSTLRQLHSRLQGHPKKGLPGIEVNTGSLGQGLSIASGLALALSKRKTSRPRVFTLLSDGELNEGQVWEALMFAGHQCIDNLVAIIDGNGLQYSGTTQSVINLSQLGEAAQALGWKYTEVDGHTISALQEALRIVSPGKPHLIFAKTTKGKGGTFLENDLIWHGKVPNTEQMATIRSKLQREIEVSHA